MGWDVLIMGIRIQTGYKLGLVLRVEGLVTLLLMTSYADT